MATIRFTQCCQTFAQDGISQEASRLPVLPRVEFYRQMLARFPHNDYATIDENMLIVAQFLKRQGVLPSLTFVSVCGCGGPVRETVIETDSDGDMLDDPHHGFFRQRLEFLR